MAPVSKLLLAPQHLSGCLFAGIYRDTRGAGLTDADRFNHFPASPLVSVSLVLSGELRFAATGADPASQNDAAPLPRLSVVGPQEAPVTSWSPGDVAAISVGFYPDAWLRFGGDAGFVTVPEGLAAAFTHLEAPVAPETAWRNFCEALGPLWAQRRAAAWHHGARIADWSRAIVTRAALSGSGRSLRSLERRIKRLSGQTRRSLDFYSSIEGLHRVVSQNSENSLADIALEAGYADQSHMGRAVRRATGFSPARLNQAIETEEPFWCYRLLGERF